jgi:probable blue pigment (indigoidine) exporter
VDSRRARFVTAALFLLVVLAWSGNYLFVKVGLASATPLWLATLRAGVGALGTAAYLLVRRDTVPLAPRDRRDALLLGIPNTAAFLGFWFVAAQRVAVGEAAVLIYTYPIWVALFAAAWMGQRLRWLHWVAVGAGFGGVVLVSAPWDAGSRAVPIGAFLELIVAAVAWASATVVFQRRFRPEQLRAANGMQLASGALVLLAASLVFARGSLPSPTPSLGLAVLWMGLFGTTFAYVVWFWLLERHRAATVSAYLFLVPLGALGLGVVFTGELVGPLQAAGVALVLASIYVVARAGRARPSDG